VTDAKTPDEEHERIARRAYEIYLARNGSDGLAEEDWLQAEAELQGQPTAPAPEPQPEAG
jgi:hypothetical protein